MVWRGFSEEGFIQVRLLGLPEYFLVKFQPKWPVYHSTLDFFTLRELFQVSFGGGKELLVFDIPNFDITPTRNVGNQLSEPPMRIAVAEFRDGV